MSDSKQRSKRSGHDLSLIGTAAAQILCRPADTYEIVNYQIEIMASRSDHFLQAEWIQEGSRAFLIYDKAGFISLEQYFLAQSAGRADIFYCLWQTVLTLRLCQDILLDSKQLILDGQFIYLKRASHNGDQVLGFDPYFIYVPVESKQVEALVDPEAAVLADVVEFFIEEGQKKELFLEEEIAALRQYVMGDIPRLSTWLEEKVRYPEKAKKRKITAPPREQKVKKNRRLVTPGETDQQLSPTRSSQPFLWKWIILLDLLLLFLLNLSLGLAIKTQAFHYYALTAVGLFILIGSDVYLLGSHKKASVSDTRFERDRRQRELRELELEEDQKQTESAFDKARAKKAVAENFSIAYLYPVANDTLQQAEISTISRRSKAAAVILNREFYIGCDTDRCDFKPQTTDLSPLHARISKQGESYLLTDLASESGTYLNNLRLHYYEDYVLFSGALIRFNDLSYLFMIEDAGDLKIGA